MDPARLRALELAVAAFSARPLDSTNIVSMAQAFYDFLSMPPPEMDPEPTGDDDYPVMGQTAA